MADDNETPIRTSYGPCMFSNAAISHLAGGQYQVAKKIVNRNSRATFKRERFDPPKCYPKTREAITAKIEAWAEERPDAIERLILWMYGPAGAGKSAITQTIAELCEGLLGASFFFSRTAEGRSDSSRLIATITWQLIQVIPEIREIILDLLERDPTLLTRTQAAQTKNLIVDPLNAVPKEILGDRPRLIIIDGLDECFPPESQQEILKLIADSVHQLFIPLYFLIASQPHPDIRDTNLTFSACRIPPPTKQETECAARRTAHSVDVWLNRHPSRARNEHRAGVRLLDSSHGANILRLTLASEGGGRIGEIGMSG